MKTNKISFATSIIIIVVLALFSIQYVAAQTATSSESAATSTTSEAGASTAAPESAAATDTGSALPTSEPSTPTDTSNAGITVAARDEIAGLEETYRRQTGKYLQIQPGNALPAYESGSVSEKLGKTIPDNMRIDVYEAPQGRGYQITYEEGGILHSIGYGPEAADRTFVITLLVPETATSTPESL